MEILTIPSGPLETNVYLVDNGAGEAILFDAAPGSFANVTAVLKEKNLSLRALFLTHGHFDHILDTRLFQEQGVPVVIHGDSAPMAEDPAAWTPFTMPGITFSPTQWREGDRLLSEEEAEAASGEWAGMEVRIITAPGHCPGSLVYYLPGLKAAVVGDVIFRGSVGRTDLRGGNMAVLLESIREKVLVLPPGTLLYPGHGPSTLVSEELEHNPYL